MGDESLAVSSRIALSYGKVPCAVCFSHLLEKCFSDLKVLEKMRKITVAIAQFACVYELWSLLEVLQGSSRSTSRHPGLEWQQGNLPLFLSGIAITTIAMLMLLSAMVAEPRTSIVDEKI